MEPFDNGLNPIKTYNNEQQIITISQLPVKHENRVKTDVCCTIFSAIYAVAMLALAIYCFRPRKLAEMTYPTDQEGRHCTLDHSGYNFLYFTSVHDPNKRLCVSNCPKGYQPQLNCWPTEKLSCTINSNPDFQVSIYPSVPTQTKIGLFCFPEDQQLKQIMLKNAHLTTRLQFVQTYHTIWISMLITLVLGVIFIIVLSYFTTKVVYGTITLGGLSAIAIGVTFLILPSNMELSYNVLKIVFCSFLIMIGLFIMSSLFTHKKHIDLCIISINQAYECLAAFKSLGLLIPLFLILTLGLIALFGFQLLSFWSYSNFKHQESYVYDIPGGSFAVITTVINFVQLIWGFSFLKQVFNFLVSGTTVTYSFLRTHYFKFGLINLFKFHWGSVVAGSFLLIFLYIFDLIYDMIRPRQSNKPLSGYFNKVCCCCDRLLGLVRSQAMSYINITGIPYCNASRWCERMSYLSDYFEGSQSINRYFRMSAHILLAFLGTIYSIIQLNSFKQTPNIPALMSNFILNMFVVTFFISLPADIAQAIFTCKLVKNYLNQQEVQPDNYHQMAKKSSQGYNIVRVSN